MTDDQIRRLKENINAELIETHISWVLLSGDKAYKIKKPVTFSFLDFSSLSVRHEMCLKEVDLNSRLSDIYLRAIPVYEDNSSVSFEEGGLLIDYAVEMKRMPDDRRMDVLLKKKAVGEDQIIQLAKLLISFHKRATVIKEEDDMEFVDQRFKNILATKDYLKRIYGQKAESILDKAMKFHEEFMVENASLFNKRVGDGFKRDLHGDLHSQNIFLLDEIVAFDCIEFDNRYRYIDVLSELAFIVMDLEYHDMKDLADLLLRAYLREFPCMENEDDKALYAYYLCYRANVRLKVNALREMQEGSDAPNERIQKYLSLLDKYLNESRP